MLQFTKWQLFDFIVRLFLSLFFRFWTICWRNLKTLICHCNRAGYSTTLSFTFSHVGQFRSRSRLVLLCRISLLFSHPVKGCFTNILFVHIPALETHYCILQSGTKRVRRLVPRELGACSQPYNIGVNSCSGDEKRTHYTPG